jgi:hypothetical protein
MTYLNPNHINKGKIVGWQSGKQVDQMIYHPSDLPMSVPVAPAAARGCDTGSAMTKD